VYQARADYEGATELYEESMYLIRERGDKQSLAYSLNNLAMLVYSLGDLASAVRSGMGEQAWEEAWLKGRAMTLDEVVSYALEEEAGG